MLFSKYNCIVLYKGKLVWKGRRQASTGLWILPLIPEGVEAMTQLQISPTKWASTVKQLREEVDMSAHQEDGQINKVNNVLHTTTKAELILNICTSSSIQPSESKMKESN